MNNRLKDVELKGFLEKDEIDEIKIIQKHYHHPLVSKVGDLLILMEVFKCLYFKILKNKFIYGILHDQAGSLFEPLKPIIEQTIENICNRENIIHDKEGKIAKDVEQRILKRINQHKKNINLLYNGAIYSFGEELDAIEEKETVTDLVKLVNNIEELMNIMGEFLANDDKLAVNFIIK